MEPLKYVCPTCGSSFDTASRCPDDHTPVEAAADPLLGTMVGSFRVACLIGKGGMGRVYRCVQPDIGSRVALKVLKSRCAADKDQVQRFFAEAKAVNLIRHEHIINILDLGTLGDGRPFVLMEYLDGASLASVLNSHGPLPLGFVLHLLGELLSALAAVHEHGIVHRDLKPANLFVTPRGHVKVLDFGIAKLQPGMLQGVDVTRTGIVVGTPRYLSPEQARGVRIDARSDVYAVGCIAYEMVTGRSPFLASTAPELIEMHIGAKPLSPQARRRQVPEALSDAIVRALAKRPEDRFSSAPEMARALKAACPDVVSEPSSLRDVLHGMSRRGAPSSSTQTQSVVQGAIGPVRAELDAGGSVRTEQTATPVEVPELGNEVPARRPSLTAWLFASAAVLGAVALAVVAIVVATGAFRPSIPAGASQPEVLPTDVAPGVPEVLPWPAGGATATEDGTSWHRSPDHTRDRFRFYTFLPEATRLARRQMKDAELVGVQAIGVDDAGMVDLTGANSVTYRFRSAAISRLSVKRAGQVAVARPCIVGVTISTFGASVVSHVWSCDEPVLPPPRCTPERLWDRAKEAGAPDARTATLLYFHGPDGQPGWQIGIQPGYREFFSDDCS